MTTFFKQSSLPHGTQTPNVEKSEGVRVSQLYIPASYLPLVRKDAILNDHVVIGYGKAIGFDSNNYVVPAGLKRDLEYALANASTLSDKAAFVAAAANFGNVYTAEDVAGDVITADGNAAEAGVPVVAYFFADNDAAGVQSIDVSEVKALAGYDFWRNNGAGYGPGGTVGNPMKYRNVNWNVQHGVSVLTRSYIELPVVANASQVKYPGLAVFEGSPIMKGLVTFNKNSNLCMFPSYTSAFAAAIAGSPTDEEIQAEAQKVADYAFSVKADAMGKVYFIKDEYPEQWLQYVRTVGASFKNPSVTDVAPGSATNGLPDNLWYAGVTDPAQAKCVRINILI